MKTVLILFEITDDNQMLDEEMIQFAVNYHFSTDVVTSAKIIDLNTAPQTPSWFDDVVYWRCKKCGDFHYKSFDICGTCQTSRYEDLDKE